MKYDDKPLNQRFAPVVAEALELLLAEHGLTVATLPRYSEFRYCLGECEVRFHGPDRSNAAGVAMLAPDGLYLAVFHNRIKDWGPPRTWTYPGERLSLVTRYGDNAPDLVAYYEASRLRTVEYFQNRDAEEAAG